jgi:GMP synthase (glutamine-hydrolysing)
VVLSGRRKNSSEINAANSKIVRQCYNEGKPVLGICYGAEIIALTLGGSIKRMSSHVSGMTSVSLSKPTKIAPTKSSLSVYESHAFCVARLPPGFQSIASSQYCEHEIFADEGKKIYGTQFHPEKSKEDGMAVLKNFATYV